jgi:hypothetical protein
MTVPALHDPRIEGRIIGAMERLAAAAAREELVVSTRPCGEAGKGRSGYIAVSAVLRLASLGRVEILDRRTEPVTKGPTRRRGSRFERTLYRVRACAQA